MALTPECVPYDGYRDPHGYGILHHTGKSRRVHRLAWELAHGPIPEGLCVLHRCDNPPCVNLAHLFLGTQGDNVRDMVSKGRNRSPNAELDRCSRGHAFNETNTRFWRNKRICRVCDAVRAREARRCR